MSATTYLDYAATAAVRPREVIEAVAGYLREIGATPGRSGHRRALDAGRVALRCRRALAELFGIGGDPGRIAFQFNATYALNTALFGVLRAGDRLVRTEYDHNAVRRPAAALRLQGVADTVLGGRPDGGVDLDEADRALRGARMLAVPHASNVTGAVLPVRELAERAHAHGALVLLDACQTAGHCPVDVEQLGVDLLAFTGHKGLLGPQGTGGLWVRPGTEVRPLAWGGTGGDSDSEGMPDRLPDRLEAGSQNGPGLAGLLAGVRWVLRSGPDALHRREAQLKTALLARCRAVPGLRVCSPAAPDGVGIVCVTHDRLDPAELARRLDREHGVLTRAGLHCAPEAHRALGTERTGAVRMSLGWATNEADVDRAGDALMQVCGAPAGSAA